MNKTQANKLAALDPVPENVVEARVRLEAAGVDVPEDADTIQLYQQLRSEAAEQLSKGE